MYFNFLILISPRDALRTIRTISRPVFMCVFISLSVSLAPVLHWNQWCDLRPSVLGQDRSETKRFGLGLGLGLAGLMLIVPLVRILRQIPHTMTTMIMLSYELPRRMFFVLTITFLVMWKFLVFRHVSWFFAGWELMTKKQHSAKVTQKKHYSPMEMFKKITSLF